MRSVEQHGLDGPVERWRELRATIHADVCTRGYDEERGVFTQSYGSKQLDAALLLIPLVGFLPPDDERVLRTIDAVRDDLERGGFVERYRSETPVDGLPAGEGAFLPCSFWLAEALALTGRVEEARDLFQRLLGLCTDLGLLSEEFDPTSGRLLGNFPQAFSHLTLVNAAFALAEDRPPVQLRYGLHATAR